MPYKKIIIVLIVVFLLLAGILVTYNFLFKEETPPGPGEDGEEPWQEEIIPSPTAKIKPLSQEPVLGPTNDGQKVKYYLKNNGHIWQSGADGSGLIQISSNNLLNLKKVIWSPDKNKVISFFQENGQLKKYFYNHLTSQSLPLDDNIQWISFSPSGEKIAYQFYNPETEVNSISIANPDGSGWQNIFNTRMKNLIIEWPSSEQISIRTRPSGLAQSTVFILNPSTKAFKQILADTYGLSILWSSQDSKVLFSETDNQGQNLKLKVADKDGQVITNLDMVTLPEKCVWSQDERVIFCAVPRVLSDNLVLPDDYYKGLFSSADDFWQINIATKQKSLLIEAQQMNQDFDAYQLFLDDQENYLFFVNRQDGLLYSLRL